MKDAGELWFLEHLKPHHQDAWKSHEEKHKPESYKEKQQGALTLLKDKVIYETAAELRERINKLK